MTKVSYTKPALTYADQLFQLKERGLIIEDDSLFLELIEKKSYYRLSGYWYPFLADKENHLFKEGSRFETAYNLYCFDRDLRQLVMKELEKIEVAVRAKMIYVFSHHFGPFWYTNPKNFTNIKVHTDTLDKITTEYGRSDAQFIKAFRRKYSNDLPPSWTAFEIISFGTVSRLFATVIPGRSKREVAAYFGLGDKALSSWLHGFVYVRNVCAHHSRLWNRVMRIQPVKPTVPKNQWLINTDVPNNRIYFLLSMIIYLMNSMKESHAIQEEFKSLLRKYPNVHTVAMGFPQEWRKELIWQ
ncbi:MAG: Abi family protein [Bacteroidales bacterium]|nr:Abi family protein [Bacteroidales bacterium]